MFCVHPGSFLCSC